MTNTIFTKSKGEAVLVAVKIALKSFLHAKLSEFYHISYIRIKEKDLFLQTVSSRRLKICQRQLK